MGRARVRAYSRSPTCGYAAIPHSSSRAMPRTESESQSCHVVVGGLGPVGVQADDDVDWLVAWLQDRHMESTPRPVPPGDVGPAQPGALDVRRSGRQRRPTGQAPPLPRSIRPTGVGWAAAAVVLVTLAKVAFGPARRSL